MPEELTTYPCPNSGPDDDAYMADIPLIADEHILREARNPVNMAKPKTVPKKFIRTAEGTRPRMRSKVRTSKLKKIRLSKSRESGIKAFEEGGPGSGPKGGSRFMPPVGKAAKDRANDWSPTHNTDGSKKTKSQINNEEFIRNSQLAHKRWANRGKSRHAFQQESLTREGGPGSGPHSRGTQVLKKAGFKKISPRLKGIDTFTMNHKKTDSDGVYHHRVDVKSDGSWRHSKGPLGANMITGRVHGNDAKSLAQHIGSGKHLSSFRNEGHKWNDIPEGRNY